MVSFFFSLFDTSISLQHLLNMCMLPIQFDLIVPDQYSEMIVDCDLIYEQ